MNSTERNRRIGFIVWAAASLAIASAGRGFAAAIVARPASRPVAVDLLTSPPAKLQAPRPTFVTGACATDECHSRYLALPFKHGPLIKGECLPCHVPVAGRHEFERRGDDESLCRSCHEPYPPGKIRHLDCDDNCAMCHDPHGGKERFFLRPSSQAGLCLDCHIEVTHERPLHPSVENDACLVCHEMHHATDKFLLRAPRDKVCLPCHDDIREGLEEGVSIHQPVAKDCMLCHVSHGGGDGPALTTSEPLTLCRSCHADLLDRAINAKYPHKAVMEDQHCVSCHDPHFATGRFLLKAPTRDLCLGCHDKSYRLSDGSVLANVKAQVTQSHYVHGPARQGSCNPCHDAHGSDYPRLLKYDFPCSFYAPFDESRYELCFRCHDRRMVLEQQSAVTRFRNGPRNLHFLHVNQEKGRTCRACHHEHASNSPLRIRETVPFGKWTMTIAFRKNESGGSCRSACHAEYGYDRVQPLQNPLDGSPMTSATLPLEWTMSRRAALFDSMKKNLRKAPPPAP
jgi:predicted CXXCH cytochrome family protein